MVDIHLLFWSVGYPKEQLDVTHSEIPEVNPNGRRVRERTSIRLFGDHGMVGDYNFSKLDVLWGENSTQL